MFKYKIKELTFSGGENINVLDAEVIILVGANNVGKSRALSDIGHLILNPHRYYVITGLETKIEGDKKSVISWLNQYYVNDSGSLQVGGSSSPANIKENKQGEAIIENNLVLRAIYGGISAENRLNLANPVKGINYHTKPFKSEVHLLQKDKELRHKISNAVNDAFGFGITTDMHFGGAGDISLRKGVEPNIENQLSKDYQLELRNMPLLHDEGHGVRSYVGCLLSTQIGHKKLIVIDEPELFLHPPQARRLSRLMATSASKLGQQIVLSTHSADIIKGILDSTDKTAIIRISRVDNVNHGYLLDGKDIKSLWTKPLLHSSGAIRGLFHKGVIVCEADADVRFYESLLQRVDNTFNQPVDFYFIHGGGKGELSTLAQSYTKLKIPTAVIADFDMLNNKNELVKLVKSVNGDFAKIDKLYNSVSLSLNELGSIQTVSVVIQDIQQLLLDIQDKNQITGKQKEKISDLLKSAGDWSEAKKYGISKLRGGKYTDCEKLLQYLREMGIFIVPNGEMESWNRSLSATKNKWILEALELINDDEKSFHGAMKFVEELVDYLFNSHNLGT